MDIDTADKIVCGYPAAGPFHGDFIDALTVIVERADKARFEPLLTRLLFKNSDVRVHHDMLGGEIACPDSIRALHMLSKIAATIMDARNSPDLGRAAVGTALGRAGCTPYIFTPTMPPVGVGPVIMNSPTFLILSKKFNAEEPYHRWLKERGEEDVIGDIRDGNIRFRSGGFAYEQRTGWQQQNIYQMVRIKSDTNRVMFLFEFCS